MKLFSAALGLLLMFSASCSEKEEPVLDFAQSLDVALGDLRSALQKERQASTQGNAILHDQAKEGLQAAWIKAPPRPLTFTTWVASVSHDGVLLEPKISRDLEQLVVTGEGISGPHHPIPRVRNYSIRITTNPEVWKTAVTADSLTISATATPKLLDPSKVKSSNGRTLELHLTDIRVVALTRKPKAK